MSVDAAALLSGLFGVPLLLLWLGHGFRNLSRAWKLGFWGGVIGYVVALVLTAVLLVAPPVAWHPEGLRAAVTHWSLLVGGVGGVVTTRLAARLLGTRQGHRG